MDFSKIMEGFVHSQIAAHKRGDFSPDAGLDYLNGVNDVLEQQLSANVTLHKLPNPVMRGFNAGNEARNAVGEIDICAVD